MIRCYKRQQGQRRRGAAMVEMAVVLPVFLTVVLGIIEFGRALMVGQMVTNASREGARLGIVDHSTNDEVVERVKTFLQNSIPVDPSMVEVQVTVTEAPGNPDTFDRVENCRTRDLVTVFVAVPYNEVSYLNPKWLADKRMTGETSMRHE